MAKYIFKNGKHFKDGKIHLAGDQVELTDQEFAAFANRFEPVAPAPALPVEETAPPRSGKSGKKKATEPEPGDPDEPGDPVE